MNVLQLGPGLRAQIEREAQAAFPRECCGLIEGARSSEMITASAFHPTGNVSDERYRFEIDPADQFRILREARARGAEVVGCYHSHPNGVAEPSKCDRESAAEEGFVWLIVALTDHSEPRLAAFIFQSSHFTPIGIEQA